MGTVRSLPKTDDERITSANTSKNRFVPIRSTDCPISEDNCTAIITNLPLFQAVLLLVANCESTQHDKVTSCNIVLGKLKNMTSHGLQLVVFKVIDETSGFTEGTLKMYNLDTNGKLPNMTTEGEIVQAANDYINGETSRVAAGGTLLADITRAAVQALLTSFLAKKVEREIASDTLLNAQADLKALRATMDDMFIKVWANIEDASMKLPEGARNTFCTNWGMFFEHKADDAFLNVTVINDGTNEAMPGVSLRIGKPSGKGGAKGVTTNSGTKEMKSKNFEPTFLIAECAGFIREVREVTLVEGQTTDITIRMKRIPKSA